MSMNATYSTILALLSAEKYLGFREQIRNSQARWAARCLETYKQDMQAYLDPTGRKMPKCQVMNLCDCGIKSDYTVNQVTMAKRRAFAMVLNDAKVMAQADAIWEADKAFYAARVSEKIKLLIGGADDINLDLSLNGVLEGRCAARCGEKLVILKTSLKTNYRYGENSANGDITIYRQVPTIVESAEGFDPVAAEKSDEDAKVQAKLDRKEKILKIQAEIKVLEKAKRQAEDVHFALRWTTNGCQSSQAEGAPSAEQVKEAAGKAKEAFKVLKGIREQIKTAKSALRAAKEAK